MKVVVLFLISIAATAQGASANNATLPFPGLTKEEKEALQKNWEVVMEAPGVHGVRILVALFAAHPEYKDVFKALKDVPMDRLAGVLFFHIHAEAIAARLNDIMTAIEDPPLMKMKLERLGRSHATKGVGPKHFEHMFQVIPTYLKKAFRYSETPLSDFTFASYEKLLANMLPYVEEGLKSKA